MIVNLYEVVNSYRHVNPSLVEQTRDILPALDAESVVDDKKYDLFSDVYVFGDSISDIGNAFDITKKINGEGLPPAPPYFRERFS
nr:GDSL family lipase [Nostocaceae cyanobacterium]